MTYTIIYYNIQNTIFIVQFNKSKRKAPHNIGLQIEVSFDLTKANVKTPQNSRLHLKYNKYVQMLNVVCNYTIIQWFFRPRDGLERNTRSMASRFLKNRLPIKKRTTTTVQDGNMHEHRNIGSRFFAFYARFSSLKRVFRPKTGYRNNGVTLVCNVRRHMSIVWAVPVAWRPRGFRATNQRLNTCHVGYSTLYFKDARCCVDTSKTFWKSVGDYPLIKCLQTVIDMKYIHNC